MKIGIINATRHKALIADRCPICHRMGEQHLTFTQRIFVFGFPVFAMAKDATVHCDACSADYPVSMAPSYVSARYAELAPGIKTPVWAYSLLIIMGVLITFALIKAPFDQNKMGELINAPKAGDVYEVRSENKSAIFHRERYTEWKVVSYDTGNISMVGSIYEVDDVKEVSKMKDHDSNLKWRDDTATYSKAWLREHTGIFCDDPHITDIERPAASK